MQNVSDIESPFCLQLISEDRFRALDKIKTIGSTYMAAVGLIPEYKILDDNEDGGLSAVHYVAQLVSCCVRAGLKVQLMQEAA